MTCGSRCGSSAGEAASRAGQSTHLHTAGRQSLEQHHLPCSTSAAPTPGRSRWTGEAGGPLRGKVKPPYRCSKLLIRMLRSHRTAFLRALQARHAGRLASCGPGPWCWPLSCLRLSTCQSGPATRCGGSLGCRRRRRDRRRLGGPAGMHAFIESSPLPTPGRRCGWCLHLLKCVHEHAQSAGANLGGDCTAVCPYLPIYCTASSINLAQQTCAPQLCRPRRPRSSSSISNHRRPPQRARPMGYRAFTTPCGWVTRGKHRRLQS